MQPVTVEPLPEATMPSLPLSWDVQPVTVAAVARIPRNVLLLAVQAVIARGGCDAKHRGRYHF